MLATSKSISGFDPRSIVGCSLWLDGADTATMNSTPTVTSWTDKSGQGYTVTGTATYSAGTMTFNGTNQAFSNTSYVFPSNAYSMFAVYSNTTAPGATSYMNVVYGSGGYPMVGVYGSSKFVSARSVVANTGALSPNVAASNVLVSATYTPSTFSPFINGSAETTLAGTTLAATGLYVGGPTNYFSGSISEILIYSATLTSTQRQSVEGYLAWKWGIKSSLPATHPFYSLPAFSRPFGPTDIPGCALWLDAADTTTITGGSAVTAWNDKSGNGVNAASPIGTITTNSTPINKLNTIRFGTTSYLTIPSLTLTTNITAFAVLRGVTTQGTGPAGYFFLGRGNQPSFFTYTTGSGSFSALFASGNETDWSLPSSNYFYNNPGIVCVTNNASYVNGTQLTLLSGSVPNNITAGTYTSLLVGGRGSGFTDSVAFDYAELIVYNTSLTTTQRQQVEGYLAAKWGLLSSVVSGHPFKSIPPSTSQPPQFQEVTPGNWTRDWQPYLSNLAAANSGATASFSTSGVSGTAASGYPYTGGVVAPNGNIYCIPQGAPVGIIDPVASTFTTFGTTVTGYFSGVLAPNGKIYCIPNAATSIAIIDPTLNTISTTTFPTGTITGTGAGAAYYGGVLAPNGKIYCIPQNATNIGVIDPVANTFTTFGTVAQFTKGSYLGGVLAPNGKIYCIPKNATYILEIDPLTNTISTFGTVSQTNTDGYYGGVLALNGKIYCMPGNSTSVGVIDPVARTFTTFGTAPGGLAYQGGTLGPNGKIYCSPLTATGIGVIDPVANTFTTLGTAPGGYAYSGAVLAPNGKIYFIPLATSSTGVITFSGLSQTPSLTYCLSPYTNKT